MQTEAETSSGAAVASFVLVAITVPLYLLAVAGLSSLAGSDAAGNALSQAYTAIAVVALWVMLAVLTIVAAVKGAMPVWAMFAALVLVPTSGAVALAVLELLSRPYDRPYLWPIVIPALTPPLIVAFCIWSQLPALRNAVNMRVVAGFAWGGVLLLCLALVPFQAMRSRVLDQRAAKIEKYQRDLASVPADAPLWEWTPFLNTPNDTQASEIRRHIRSNAERQQQAELMLERGDFPLGELGQFDLDPTPSLCEKARAQLRRRAAALVSPRPGTKPYTDIAVDVSDAVAAMNWLTGYECACDEESLAWETTANGYRDTNYDVYRLKELRDPKNLGRIVREHPERFSQLTPKAHLKAWLKFADDKQFGRQALEGARKLDHRTTDAAAMLIDKYDIAAPWTALRYLPVLDLEATAALCTAALSNIRSEMARVYRPKPDDPRSFRELMSRLGDDGSAMPALKWLAAHGCDAEAALNEAEALIASYQDSPERAAMLASLATLHRK